MDVMKTEQKKTNEEKQDDRMIKKQWGGYFI